MYGMVCLMRHEIEPMTAHLSTPKITDSSRGLRIKAVGILTESVVNIMGYSDLLSDVTRFVQIC